MATSLQCELLDLTQSLRMGWRGKHAANHLAACGLPQPETINQAVSGDEGELVLRLGQKEFWLLGNPADSEESTKRRIGHFMTQTPPDHCYSLPCLDSHAWLQIRGEKVFELMSKLCAIDLRDSACNDYSIVQTSVARISSVLVKQRCSGQRAVSVLFDRSYLAYMRGVFEDAMQEFV